MNSSKKNLFSWLAYDFGNSFFVNAISGLFLAQWLILDNKIADIWYGAGFALATILVLISSPYLGAWSDKAGKRMPFLKIVTILLFIFNGLMALVAVSNLPMIHRAFIVLGLFVIVQYLYQISLIFYNALLNDVSTEKNRGKISGIGEGFGSLGWLVGSVVLLPFATGAITLIGDSGRSQVFVPAFIISTLLMLPLLFLFKENSPIKEKSQKESIGQKTIEGLKKLFKENKNVGLFLVAFALISDIVLTLTLYFAIVMDVLYGVNDTAKTMAFGVYLIITIIFGYILGELADRYGHKRMLTLSCVLLIIGSIMLFFSSSLWALYAVMVIAGIGAGGYFVVSKSLMIKISPQNQLGEYFGLYSTFSRSASVLAPLVWGGIVFWLRNFPILKYQVAGISMIILLIVGTLMLYKVKENSEKDSFK